MKCQTISSFKQHLESRSLARVYLIAMPDDFERKKWLDVLASMVKSPDQQILHLSAADLSLSELLTAIDSPSLFDPEPIALVDELEKISKKQAAGLIGLLERPHLSGYFLFGSRTKGPIYSAAEKWGVVFDLCDEKPWDKEKRLSWQISERIKEAGKRVSPQVLQMLLERTDRNLALLEKEVDKLICYVGEKGLIEPADVEKMVPSSRTHTLWQIAEEMVWEGKYRELADENSFHGLVPALRFQLQLGLKLASFINAQMNSAEVSAKLPKIWPKTIEKRLSQVSRFGISYFQKGLQLLFRIEMLSRSQTSDLSMLIDFFYSSFVKGKSHV